MYFFTPLCWFPSQDAVSSLSSIFLYALMMHQKALLQVDQDWGGNSHLNSLNSERGFSAQFK